MKIDETTAYKASEPMVQQMIMKRVNRVEIEDQIIIARTIGLAKWKTQTGLQARWQKIVIEIIESENIN